MIVSCNQDPDFEYFIYVSIPPSFINAPVSLVPTIWSYAFLTYGNQSKEPIPPIISPTNVPSNDSVFKDNVLLEYKLRPLQDKTVPGAGRRIVVGARPVWNPENGNPMEDWVLSGKVFAPPTAPLLQTGYLGNDVDSVGVEFKQNNVVHKTTIYHLTPGNVYLLQIPRSFVEKKHSYVLLRRYEIVVLGDDHQDHYWHIHGFTVDFVAAGYLNMSEISSAELDKCNNTIHNMSKLKYDFTPKFDNEAKVIARGDSFSLPRQGYPLDSIS